MRTNRYACNCPGGFLHMDNETLKHRFSRQPLYRSALSILALLLLFVPLLANCGTPAQLEFVPINLGIPSPALDSPVSGPLPDATKLHVLITFKVSQGLIDKLSSQVHPHQPSHLE